MDLLASWLLIVDSIGHGSFADAESYDLMKAHGTCLAPTLLGAQTAIEIARAHSEQLNPSSAAKALIVGPRMRKNLGDAYRAGVKIAFGANQGLAPHGINAREFALPVHAVIMPRDAIAAATTSAADLIGDADDIGSIQPRRYADIIAVAGDPLADVTQREHMRFVMIAGHIYKTDGKPLTPVVR